MARRYARDNRGRFASVGATARGGRLATAAGNKRATQTKEIAGGKPAGTIGKSGRSAKPSNEQLRQMQADKVRLDRKASAASARMGNTNASPADQVRFHKEAQSARAQSAAISRTLKANPEPPHIYARGRALTGESMGKYKGQGRFSLYGKDRGKIERAKLPSAVRKPRGLQPSALTAKPAAKPAAKPKVSKAEKAVAAAQKRLRTKQYGSTANQSQNLLVDRRIASMTPQQYGAQQVRSARAMVRREQSALRNPLNANAPQSWRSTIENSLARYKREFAAAAADYRILKPKKRK
jgi:hypothetical protein